jgi:hypothetical protein
MILDYVDFAKATLAKERLKGEGLVFTFDPNHLLTTQDGFDNAGTIVHRLEVEESQASRAKEILFRFDLMP